MSQARARITFGYFFMLSVFGVSWSASGAEIPPDHKVIRSISKESFPHVVRLLNWNVKKGEEGQAWASDLREFTKGRNLVTIQEGHASPLMESTLQSLPGFSFIMTNAFVYRGWMTGVITGSSSEPTRADFRRSRGLEPVFNSPKMTSLSYFKMDERQELLVANLHGLNFVSLEKFEEQLSDVAEVIAKHTGPVILAGDFNNWNPSRSQILDRFAQTLSLQEVSFARPESDKSIDHVFVKSCTVEKAWMLPDVKSSDHFPQFVNLRCGASR